MNRVAGYLQGNVEQHLDHLAPLCSLMGWPLIVTDESIYELSKAYYPGLKLHLWNVLEAPFLITQQYDTVITTLPRISFDESFFIAEATLSKRLKTVWLPHGNSDKGHVFPMIEALKDEEAAFVYGPKMVDFLNAKNVKIPRIIPIGNFRYVYFQKHRSFYEKILDEMGLEKNFTLYAPTWKDAENSSSFESSIDEVIDKLSNTPLVIKPHPNELEDVRVIQRQLSTKVKWLDHFPPIYPLLSRTSHLIGDFSSIGYDFLHFNRPMTFFNPTNRKADDPGLFLHHCRQEDRPALARYTFGEESTWIPLLEKVKQLDI